LAAQPPEMPEPMTMASKFVCILLNLEGEGSLFDIFAK
jgi:hypothetical protein